MEEAGLVPYMTMWVFLYYMWNSGAHSHSIAELLSLPGDTSFLGNTLITCPSKMPLGMVWDQAHWNVGKSLSPPARKEPERLLTDNEVEVAWERAGEFQGKIGVRGSPVLSRQWQWLQMGLHCLHSPGAPTKECHHQQVQAALLSAHAMDDMVWEMLFWPVQQQHLQEQLRIRQSCCCAEPAWGTAVYFWEVNLHLLETPIFLKGGSSAWIFPLNGRQWPFLSSFFF